jgi:hypothetical protein
MPEEGCKPYGPKALIDRAKKATCPKRNELREGVNDG